MVTDEQMQLIFAIARKKGVRRCLEALLQGKKTPQARRAVGPTGTIVRPIVKPAAHQRQVQEKKKKQQQQKPKKTFCAVNPVGAPQTWYQKHDLSDKKLFGADERDRYISSHCEVIEDVDTLEVGEILTYIADLPDEGFHSVHVPIDSIIIGFEVKSKKKNRVHQTEEDILANITTMAIYCPLSNQFRDIDYKKKQKIIDEYFVRKGSREQALLACIREVLPNFEGNGKEFIRRKQRCHFGSRIKEHLNAEGRPVQTYFYTAV